MCFKLKISKLCIRMYVLAGMTQKNRYCAIEMFLLNAFISEGGKLTSKLLCVFWAPVLLTKNWEQVSYSLVLEQVVW